MKSTIVVVPPQAAALVPVSKESDAVVPPNGISMCVWASIPPGMTYFPVASMTLSTEAARSAPSAAVPGTSTATMVSPSMSTSWRLAPVELTTVPPLIKVVMSTSLRRGDQVVGLGPAVAVERPVVARLGQLRQVQITDHQFVLVLGGDIADIGTARADEVAGPVEAHRLVAELVRFDADPVVGPAEVLVGGGRGPLPAPPQPVGQARFRGRRVENDLRVVQSEFPPALREMAVVTDVHAAPTDRSLENRIAEVPRPEIE